MELSHIRELLKSEIHEHRSFSLIVLTEKYNAARKKKESELQQQIYDFYLNNTDFINNWDLVDVSCHYIVGNHLLDKPSKRDILQKLANSDSLWERRISMVSTMAFIRCQQFEDTMKIAEILLKDRHDLIHKAVGWMLREVGKRNQEVEEEFLEKHHKEMPRTMLRYALEKFSSAKKKYYMKKE